MWQKLSTVSKVPAAEYFVKNFRIWCQGCRLCGVVPTTLAQSVMFQNRRSKNISRAKREDSAKDVQISPYPTRPQTEALMVQLSEACRLYNAALQERIEAYRTHHKSINYCDQAAQLTEIRKAGNLGLPNCHCAQDVLRRLEKAFKAFFQRIKRGQKPGFPRFKSSRRYDSITFPSHGDGNKLLSSGHLFVQGVGNIKVKLHARCTARLRPSRSSENANTGTSASQSKLLCSHCPRQKQPWASTLVCLLSQRCQTTPRLKTRGCIAKRRRNFVVPNVV